MKKLAFFSSYYHILRCFFYRSKLKQYSDDHITPNAVVQNEKFTGLAFAPAPQREQSNQLALFGEQFNYFPTKPKVTNEYGTWIWTPTLSLTQNTRKIFYLLPKSRA